MIISQRQDERRTAIREERSFPARYRLGTEADSYRRTMARDISVTGVRLEWNERVSRGARVSLNLSPEPMCHLTVTGTVMWTRATETRGIWEVGVCFERVNPADRKWLDRKLGG